MKTLFSLFRFFLLSLFFISLFPSQASAVVSFRRPTNTVLDPAISAYYDNSGKGGGERDFRCGTDTYDNHQGTDFRATVGTSIYAGARGGVYHQYNGCATYGYYGSNCGGGFGNNVRLDHEGNLLDGVGTRSIYAHMQKNTPIALNRTVSCGQYVGASGSSGSSTGPHVHFEVLRNGHPRDDPYAGACNARGADSPTYWNLAYDPLVGFRAPAAWCPWW